MRYSETGFYCLRCTAPLVVHVGCPTATMYARHAPQFRDELLLLKPRLLDALLTKANSSQQDFDQYADTCVLILSRPLPLSVPLPSSAQDFFLRVFQKSNQNPCVETLKPVYYMLNGACHQLFSLLPHDAQHQFDQQLRHILKSSDVGKDAMLLLWCFGVVLLVEYPGKFKRSPAKGLSQIVPTQGAKPDWKTASGQKLFLGSTSLYRTMTLASLSVIWAIKGGVGVTDEEAIEGIRIASRVLRVADRDVRENWPRSDTRARGTFLKLVEKIERLDTKSAIFFQAAGFHALIIGTAGLKPNTVTQYELCLARTLCMAPDIDLEDSLSESLPIFAVGAEHSLRHNLLKGHRTTSSQPQYNSYIPMHSRHACRNPRSNRVRCWLL
ncbi:hypothetical protein T440DRAFT_525020 [Plenodomus tracheiphilus IPT5]|uniref:Uncharacterized protein n=1 Tax=Plenodomus tracheiphilus IPT5 TaxID=1408161 RepID=A0A6A7BNQ5_9PLEO|nr:hypothetical protein T440DRAFT_525020 [Plenodomus tracheiphilus IPT5]